MTKFPFYLAFSCLTFPALADTVWLKNGDRLTGSIQLYDGGKLLLKTDYAGVVTLSGSQIATLESERPLLIKHDAEHGEHAKALKPAAEGQVELVNGEQPRQVAISEISQILPPRTLALAEDWVWQGNADFSVDYKRAERDVDDYDIAVKTSARHGLWRHNLQGSYNRELKDDVKTTDNYSAEYALDRFIDEHWFWQTQGQYKHDKIEDLKIRRSIGTGPGYQFWDNELGALSLASLLNRSDYKYQNGETEHFYSLGMKWDYRRYLIGKTFEVFSNGEVGKPLDSNISYELDTQLGLRYKITSWASLNVKAEWDKLSSKEGDVNERRYSMGFGVAW